MQKTSKSMSYPLFELVPLIRVRDEDQAPATGTDPQETTLGRWPAVRLCAQRQCEMTSTIMLVCNNDYILIRHEEWGKETITKQLQWYQNPQRKIQAITLDPTATWAVVVCQDTSVHIVPIGPLLVPKTQLTKLWKTDDLTEITLTAKKGVPKVVKWWQSSDGKRVAIVGTANGEILFVDLTLLRDVRTVTIKDEAIAALDIVYHDVTGIWYLLIHTKSGNQWGLLLERTRAHKDRLMSEGDTAAALGYEIIQSESVPRHSILHSEEGNSAYFPVRFQQFVNEVVLSPQVCLGHTFVSAHDRSSSIFKVFDSSIDNWLPLHVYRLPPATSHVVLTDRLMFAISKEQDKSALSVLSNHLSETASQDQPANEDALTQIFDLPPDEEIIGLFKNAFPNNYLKSRTTQSSALSGTRTSDSDVHEGEGRGGGDSSGESSIGGAIGEGAGGDKDCGGSGDGSSIPEELLAKVESHSVLDGCVLITDAAIYQCKPRCSPEGLFLELALKDENTTSADNLGITLGLDVNYLYEIVAVQKLADGQCQQAMKLFHRSECPYLKQAKLFLEQGCIREVLTLVSIALSRPLELCVGDRRDIADIAINCYVQEVLHGQAEQELLDSFSQFLKDNFDYNEVKALDVFAECGLYEILFEVARARGLVAHALEVVLSRGSPELPSDIQTSLINQGFITSIARAADSAVVRCMTSHDAIDFLLNKPELAFCYMELMSRCLEDLEPRTLMKLAWLFDPSKDAIKPLLSKVASGYAKSRARTLSSGSLFSVDSYSSDSLDPNQVYPKPTALVEFFLKVLVILNHKQEATQSDQSEEFDIPGLDWHVSGHAKSSEGDEVPSIRLAQQRRVVDCGQNHVAVVAAGGDVFTWGRAHNGRLGHGDIIPADGRAAPFRVETLHMHKIRVIAVSCGKEHTVALGDQGKVYAWGSSQCAQLGCGDYITRTRPALVEGLIGRSTAAIACGQYHTLALTQDQRVYSWGWGVHGQLGHGNIDDQLHPRHITSLDPVKVTHISAGYCHSGVLSNEGQLYMFGSSAFGQLGSGNNNKSSVPQLVKGISHERVVSFGCGYFNSIAVTACPQSIYIWGRSPLELRQALQESRKRRSGHSRDARGGGGREFHGRGRSTAFVGVLPGDDKQYLSPSVLDCNIYSAIEQVICSCNHHMLLTVSGELYSWGRNDTGQLGLSNRCDQKSPILIPSSSNQPIAVAAAGMEFSVAVTYQGRVLAWGAPEFGQLGMDKGSAGHHNTLYANPRMRKMGHPNMASRPVLSPTAVPALPQISVTCDLEADDSDEENSPVENSAVASGTTEVPFDWTLPDLAHPDPESSQRPYSNSSIQLALHSLDSHYNHQKVLQLCVDHENWSAAAEICELDGDYTQALDYRLRGFLLAGSDEKETCAEEAVVLIDKYIKSTQERFVDSDNDLQKAVRLIIIQVLNFWNQHNFAQERLEDLFRQHLTLMAYPLSLLIFSKPNTSQSSTSCKETRLVPQEICDKFSSQLCLDVTQAVMQRITEGKPHEEYVDILKQSAANPQAVAQMGLGDTPPEGGILLTSQPDSSVPEEKLWEEILHNLRKDIHSRAYISLSASEVANLVESGTEDDNLNDKSASEKRKDCIVFTCGHYYDRQTFQNATVPQWLGNMGKLPVPLPTSAEVFSTQYRKGEGFLPMACPRCVHSGLHQEQLKQEATKQN